MNEQIEKCFTYHPPKSLQPEMYKEIRDKAKEFAYLLDDYCPHSREKIVAMQKIEEAVFWANASIAREDVKGEVAGT